MESEFLKLVRSGDLTKLNNYLRTSLPSADELADRIKSSLTLPDVKPYLEYYSYLLSGNLQDYPNQDYLSAGINNLMLISSNGYLPLLQEKTNQLPGLINQKSKDRKTALHYALDNYENIQTVVFLINNGADLSIENNKYKTPLEIIKDYSSTLQDLNYRKAYQEVYDQLVPPEPSYFSAVPTDIVSLIVTGTENG